jgi:hypothetical protein
MVAKFIKNRFFRPFCPCLPSKFVKSDNMIYKKIKNVIWVSKNADFDADFGVKKASKNLMQKKFSTKK